MTKERRESRGPGQTQAPAATLLPLTLQAHQMILLVTLLLRKVAKLAINKLGREAEVGNENQRLISLISKTLKVN